MLEFFEDLIDKDPNQEFPQDEFAAGKSFVKTGDAITDAWSKAISEGKTPDFLEAFDAEDRAKLRKLMNSKSEPQKDETPKVSVVKKPDVPIAQSDPAFVDLEFHDDYSKEPKDV